MKLSPKQLPSIRDEHTRQRCERRILREGVQSYRAEFNFGALLVHQYEEYEDPGYFPAQFNRGLFKSDLPDHYPLNTHTAIAYPFYILRCCSRPKSGWASPRSPAYVECRNN